jgi:uncharacterized membrane protein (DUF373 family)
MPSGPDKDPLALIGSGVVIVCLAIAYTLLRNKK